MHCKLYKQFWENENVDEKKAKNGNFFSFQMIIEIANGNHNNEDK